MSFFRTLAICTTIGSGPVFAGNNQETINNLKQQSKSLNWTFEVGDTPMLQIPEDQGTGFKREGDWRTKAAFSTPPATALPARFDWREHGVVGPVRDQAVPIYCGSCWAHGTTAAFESAIAIKTGRLPSISPQQLVSCHPSYGTCGGGDFAFGFYRQEGANYDSDFPYVADDVACKEDAQHHEKAADWGYVGSPDREPTTDELKGAIYNYGPVAVTVSSTVSWRAYRSGVYNACDGTSINHIVALVGWNDANQTWIVKNSHGTAWGEQGYMNSKYTNSSGRKCNGIGESAAWVTYQPSHAR